MRALLGAFGDPGHAFPMMALGRALVARGHDVTFQTWARWRDDVEAEGMAFAPAPEYHVFPTLGRHLKPYEAVVRAARDTLPLVEALAPDVVVADILTLAPALAAELRGVPVATLIPHVDPRPAPGSPVYSIGARMPRTAGGRAMWDRLGRVADRGLQLGRRELDATRGKLGLAPLARVHGGISQRLALVATLPELEYPRPAASAPGAHVVGPLLWEPPTTAVELPPGEDPLVLVAPSTSQDPSGRLLRAAVSGLADLDVRVIATWNRIPPPASIATPPRARVVEWLSYAQTMPSCAVVVCHAGHGTVVRALTSGCVVVAVPDVGDMNENAARLDWAGLGVRVPRRLLSAPAVRLAVGRALDDHAMRARVDDLASRFAAAEDPGDRAARLVEQLAG